MNAALSILLVFGIVASALADTSIREMQRRKLVGYETSLSQWSARLEELAPQWRELVEQQERIAAIEADLAVLALIAGHDAQVRAQETLRKAAIEQLAKTEPALYRAVARAKAAAELGQDAQRRAASVEARQRYDEMTASNSQALTAQTSVERLLDKFALVIKRYGGPAGFSQDLDRMAGQVATDLPAWQKALSHAVQEWRALTQLEYELDGLEGFSESLRQAHANAANNRDRALLQGYRERLAVAAREKADLQQSTGELAARFDPEEVRRAMEQRWDFEGIASRATTIIEQCRALLKTSRLAAGTRGLQDAARRLKLASGAIASLPATSLVAGASATSRPGQPNTTPAPAVSPPGAAATPAPAHADAQGGLVISPQVREIGVGESRALRATDHGGRAYTDVEWVSSNSMSLAISGDGRIVGQQIGKAIVLAKAGDLRAWLDVKVVATDGDDATADGASGWGDAGWDDAPAIVTAADDSAANAGWGDSGWDEEPGDGQDSGWSEDDAGEAPSSAVAPPHQASSDGTGDELAGDWMSALQAIYLGDAQAGRRSLDQYAERCADFRYPDTFPFASRDAVATTARNCMLKRLELAELRGVKDDPARGVLRMRRTGQGYEGLALAADQGSDYGHVHQNTILNRVRSVTPGTRLLQLQARGNGRYAGQCLVATTFDAKPDRWARCELQVITEGRAILFLYWQPDLHWIIWKEKAAWTRLGSAAPPMRMAALIRIRGGLGPPIAAPASASTPASAGGAPGARGGNCWVGCRPGSSPLHCAVACDGQFSATTALANGGHTVYKLKNASWEQCAQKMRELGQAGW